MRDRRRREETAVPAETIEEAIIKTQEPLQASAFLGLLVKNEIHSYLFGCCMPLQYHESCR